MASSLLLLIAITFLVYQCNAFVSPGKRTYSSTKSSLSAIKEATFGMGCFWEPSETLARQDGVLATTVGYTGAPPNKPRPLYDNVCFGNDWVEAVRVVYDDEIISYDTLLDDFFQYQKPAYSRQYASVIFTNNSNEEKDAKEWKKDRVSKQQTDDDDDSKKKNQSSYDIVNIEPSSTFYKAEEYHQRYWEKFRIKADIAVLLIAAESGVFDKIRIGSVVLADFQLFDFSFDTICGALFLAGAVWTLLERAIARDVIELKGGDLILSTVQK